MPPHAALVLLVVAALAGCAGARGSGARGDAFAARLDSLSGSAGAHEAAGDTARAVWGWIGVATQAADPPRRLARTHRAAACAHAARARSALDALHPGPLVFTRDNSDFFIRGTT